MASQFTPPPDGDRNRGPAVLITQGITVGIATILVVLRIIVRSKVIKELGLDDLFIVGGMITTLVVFAITVIQVHYGMGRHSYYLSFDNQIVAAKWQYINESLSMISTMLTRVSICLFLLRLFTTGRKRRWIIYATMLVVVLANMSLGIIIFCQCRPVQKTWNPLLPGECWNSSARLAVGYFQGASTGLVELILAILPITFLWDIQIPFRTKLGICCLMGLGIFTVLCSAVRTFLTSGLSHDDFTYIEVDLNIWVGLELSVGLIAATIPTLRPLVRIVLSKWRPSPAKETRFRSDYHNLNHVSVKPIRPLRFSHPREFGSRLDFEPQRYDSTKVSRYHLSELEAPTN